MPRCTFLGIFSPIVFIPHGYGDIITFITQPPKFVAQANITLHYIQKFWLAVAVLRHNNVIDMMAWRRGYCHCGIVYALLSLAACLSLET